jgi:hypothetical protein
MKLARFDAHATAAQKPTTAFKKAMSVKLHRRALQHRKALEIHGGETLDEREEPIITLRSGNYDWRVTPTWMIHPWDDSQFVKAVYFEFINLCYFLSPIFC